MNPKYKDHHRDGQTDGDAPSRSIERLQLFGVIQPEEYNGGTTARWGSAKSAGRPRIRASDECGRRHFPQLRALNTDPSVLQTYSRLPGRSGVSRREIPQWQVRPRVGSLAQVQRRLRRRPRKCAVVTTGAIATGIPGSVTSRRNALRRWRRRCWDRRGPHFFLIPPAEQHEKGSDSESGKARSDPTHSPRPSS